jgi:SEC-C motif-containing protein
MSGPNAPCPCGGGQKYKRCCRRFHYGAPPPHAELLMRARYAAYAVGEVDFILATTHPASPHFRADTATWRSEVQRFSQQTRFESLTVKLAEEDGDTARVRFFARLRQGARDASFGEESTFRRVDGRWLYLDGKPA